MSEKEILWDLTEVFASVDDPKIKEIMEFLMKKAERLINHYKSQINTQSFTAENLYYLLKDYEDILARLREISSYSANSFNANMALTKNKLLWNRILSYRSNLLTKLAFIELDIGKLIEKKPQIIDESILSNYKHYLEKIEMKFPYNLAEAEEILILEKDQHGIQALEQLRTTWISNRTFKANIEGIERIITRSETFPLFQHPERETRKSVFKGMYTTFEEDQEIYASVVRNVFGDWVKNVKRRNYESYIHQSLIDNEINQVIIDNMMKTINNNTKIYQKFWKTKSKVLSIPKIEGFDIPAYLPLEKRYNWDDVKKISIQAFERFDKIFGEIVTDMFEKKHIDAGARNGKTDFVYCNAWYRGKSAFILTGYSGLLSDIKTLSHELGHAIHKHLAAREQTFLNFEIPLVVEEIASFFGELLLIDYLLSNKNSTREKINILTNQLNQVGIVIFHMTARMWCEQNLYNATEKGEFLDGNTISKYWCDARDKIYRESVKWSDDMKLEWVNFSYYCSPYNRFLNYQYSFAQLFVYALYQNYKQEGRDFATKYKSLLSAGNSKTPEELAKIVNLDIIGPEIWNLGMRQYELFVSELDKLTNLN